MKRKIIIFIVLLLIILSSVTLLIIADLKKINLFDSIKNIIILLVGFLLTFIPNSFLSLTDNTNWKTSQRKLQKGKIINKDTLIRISFAYLFRIKVDGKYLLVENSRNTGKYQPVGGAYKYDEIEKEYLHNTFHFEYDDKIPIDNTSKNDYRLYIKNKFLRKFVKRFETTKNRENEQNVSREFIEEIIVPNKELLKDDFKQFSYIFEGRYYNDVKYSSKFECYEMLIHDIYDVKLSDEQENKLAISKLKRTKCFTEKDIKKQGISTERKALKESISNHSWEILEGNADKLTIIDKSKKRHTIDL